MDNTTDRDRVLRVRTGLHNRDAIIVAVEDSGPGLDPKQSVSIFDAFFTTKLHGIGLGLAICRVIAERHSGQLTAATDGNNGARFQFVLPTESTDSAHAN
jgi:signal transduction histidine kinase